MKRSTAGALALALVVGVADARPQASPPPVSLPGTEVRELGSPVNGVAYRLMVNLPESYWLEPDRRYPVLYLLDANLAFGLARDTYWLQRAAGYVPELIIVGIGWPENVPSLFSPFYNRSRTRDLTPTVVASAPGSGGGPAFLRAIRGDIIPYVDSVYRTDPGDRGILGASFGGLFSTYVLLHEPDAFQRYSIGSPSYWWDGGVAFAWESTYAAAHRDLAARVFLSVGAWETREMVPPMLRMDSLLRSRRYPGLRIEKWIVPDESHTSVAPAALSRAFRVLYGKSEIAITADQLRRYVGRYRQPGGTVVTVTIEAGRLFVDIPGMPALHLELRAYDEHRFFSYELDYLIQFAVNPAGRPTSLTATQGGATVAAERLP